MDTMTVESITAAASKVTSLTKLGYELGFKSKINGTTIKQIKALVPNVMDLMAKKVLADIIFPNESKAPVQPVQLKVEAPVSQAEQKSQEAPQETSKKVKAPKTPKVPKAPKAKGDSPYRGAYGVLFTAAKEFNDRTEIIQQAAKVTGKDEKLMLISYYVLSNPKHRSNQGRSKEEVNAEGKVRLIACQEATEATSEATDATDTSA
jgi:hypothetical protein